MMGKYIESYEQSLNNPNEFWGNAAKAIDWDQPATKVLDDSNAPMYRWFSGAKLNTCYNALDRHVKNGRADQAALIYDSPVTDTKRTYSYQELLDEVAKLAGVLTGLGVTKGDRVLIYMPMIPQGVMAMLACARIGAVHSVVFGGFAAAELAVRIDDAKPKVVLSTSCGIEGSRIIKYKPLLDGAIELAEHKPTNTVIFQRPQEVAAMQEGRDVDWADAVANATPADCVSVEATDPLYILYTSGTNRSA
jgi:Acyl-coenzyme A synthetases/AMP-(fatty) acid ligases